MALGLILRRLLAFSVPVALGVMSVVYSGILKQVPAPTITQSKAVPVRVLTVEPVLLQPRIRGQGIVSPVREWRAVARIEGEVTDSAERLAAGTLFDANALLFRIDDSDLKLDLAQIDAQLAAAVVKDDTLAASLDIAESDLALTRKELARQEKLTSQGVTTQTTLEAARRQELSARARFTEIDNQRRVGDAEREVLLAQRASVARSLGFAEIRAPYDLRITDVTALAGQYITRGQTLLAGEGVEAVEVAAQFAMGRIGPMLRLLGNGMTVMDLDARVLMSAPGHEITWQATVARVGDAIDPRTQSATVVVRVDNSQAMASAGRRPPLRRNMFIEVLLLGKKIEVMAVPIEAVRNNVALLITAEGQLEKRPVNIGFVMGNLAVVESGLSPGDQLVLTSPTIAVPGMDVMAIEDEARKMALVAEAAGTSSAVGGGGSGRGKSGGDGNTSTGDNEGRGQ